MLLKLNIMMLNLDKEIICYCVWEINMYFFGILNNFTFYFNFCLFFESIIVARLLQVFLTNEPITYTPHVVA